MASYVLPFSGFKCKRVCRFQGVEEYKRVHRAFRVDAPIAVSLLFIKRYLKMTRRLASCNSIFSFKLKVFEKLAFLLKM